MLSRKPEGSKGKQAGLKGRRVERWALQSPESARSQGELWQVSGTTGKSCLEGRRPGCWSHEIPVTQRLWVALRVGWDVTSLGRQLLETETPWEKEAAGSYYQPAHSSWQCWHW